VFSSYTAAIHVVGVVVLGTSDVMAAGSAGNFFKTCASPYSGFSDSHLDVQQQL